MTDISIVTECSSSDHHDRTPLHMAAIKGSQHCVDYILDVHPESLNAVDNHQVNKNNLRSCLAAQDVGCGRIVVHQRVQKPS